MFIYLIINDVNWKIYVGKTANQNLQGYLQEKFRLSVARPDLRSKLFSAIRKYGSEHFHIYPMISNCQTNEMLCYWEQILIKTLSAQDNEVGYNICRGGEGFTGSHSQESRMKMSEQMKVDYDSGKRKSVWRGKTLSEQQRKKMSESQKRVAHLRPQTFRVGYIPPNKGKRMTLTPSHSTLRRWRLVA